MWQSSEVPADWERGKITPTFKKGKGPRELQASQSHFCAWQDHGADPPGNYADNIKLYGVVNTLEGRDVIQRDHDRLERWACANPVKFNMAKCKASLS